MGRSEFSTWNGGWQKSQARQQRANVSFGCTLLDGTVFSRLDFLSNQSIEGVPSDQLPRSGPRRWPVKRPSGT
jgi:hypothetical protein